MNGSNGEKISLNKEVRLLLERGFPKGWFCSDPLFENERNEDYYDALSKFRFLFSANERSRTYLWNELFFRDYNEKISFKEDFTLEQLSFMEEIYKTHINIRDNYCNNIASKKDN